MKIGRMKEGQLYEIKPLTHVSTSDHAGPNNFPVVRGWRDWSNKDDHPPFIYLGFKQEEWSYNYQHTNKIHYVLWKDIIYIMDNQFAKHIVPVWEDNPDG